METVVMPSRFRWLTCPRLAESTAANWACSTPAGQQEHGCTAEGGARVDMCRQPRQSGLTLQPSSITTGRCAPFCRPSTAPCKQAGTAASHSNKVCLAKTLDSKPNSTLPFGCAPGVHHRANDHAGLGLPPALSAGTRAVAENANSAKKTQPVCEWHSFNSVRPLPNRSPTASAADVVAIDAPTLSLGLQRHNSAFMRAWHSRVNDSVKQQSTTLTATHNCLPEDKSSSKHSLWLCSIKNGRGEEASNDTDDADRNQRFQRLQLGQIRAGHDRGVVQAKPSTKIRTEGSSRSLPNAVVMVTRQHAVAAGAAAEVAASTVERSASGPGGAHADNRFITTAAQQWLRQQSMIAHYHCERLYSTPIVDHSAGWTLQNLLVAPRQTQSLPLSAAPSGAEFSPLLGAHALLSEAEAEPGPRQLLELHVPQEGPSDATARAEGLQVSASDLLDRCTVQSSKKIEMCSICLDNIAVNELAPLLLCGHRMHRLCLVKWVAHWLVGQALTSGKVEVVCPLCKQASIDRQVLAVVKPANVLCSS